MFAINPTGARYDAIINPGGESDNADWDGIWEAATARLPTGWSAEIRIPVLTIAFKPGLHEWQFNVQRRIQRRLEIDRWASPNSQYQITQTSQAGLLTDLPDFDLGVGLTSGRRSPVAAASRQRLSVFVTWRNVITKRSVSEWR